SFVPDGTQGSWPSNPPMNRWAICYRPDGLRLTIAGWSLARCELSKLTMPSRAFRAHSGQPRKCGIRSAVWKVDRGEEGMLFKVNTDGTGFTILHSFAPFSGPGPYTNSEGANPIAGLILSGRTLYGTAYG